MSDSDDRVGSTLRDKWVLEKVLGVGGMATVYAAQHKIGRREAIKVLHKRVAASESLRSRFEQEAHAVNSFKHPGVVEIRDIDKTEDDVPFLVMELLEGEPLSGLLNRDEQIEVRTLLEIAAQVLDVLAAAHARGIIHRDIKPDNIFIQAGNRAKVLDFGIAQVRSADKRALTTKAGVTLGTMAYMSPEQARGEEIDGRTDVYAVGATMFRALAGRFVHDADSQQNLIMKVIAHGAPRIATVVPNVEPNIAMLIDRALAFDVQDRYPNAKTMLDDLHLVLAGAPPPHASSAPPIPERPRASDLFDDPKNKATAVGMRASTRERAANAIVNAGSNITPIEPPTKLAGSGGPLTKLSSDHMPAASSIAQPTSERVVIVPSQRSGVAPTLPGDAEIATVHGLAPPPNLVQISQAPTTPRTHPGEPHHSVFAQPAPSLPLVRSNLLIFAIGGGAALLALILLIATLVWSSSSKPETAQTPDDEIPPLYPSDTAQPSQTAAPLPPPPTPSGSPSRRSRRR